MKREYWNGLAERYDDEIFDVLGSDSKNLIRRLIKKYGGAGKKASDYGCGPGKFLTMLSENFVEVNAIDICYKFITQAKNKYKHIRNIKYFTADLAKDGLKLEKTHFALSINMLIMPALVSRVRILDVMVKHILKNGHLVLVVPSLESAMLADYRLIEWNLRSGIKPSSAVRQIFGDAKRPNYLNLCQGVVPIDGVPTKHYLKEEIETELSSRGLQIIDILKIEYPWNTEFDRPPKWMKGPYPWDWLVAAEKV